MSELTDPKKEAQSKMKGFIDVETRLAAENMDKIDKALNGTELCSTCDGTMIVQITKDESDLCPDCS